MRVDRQTDRQTDTLIAVRVDGENGETDLQLKRPAGCCSHLMSVLAMCAVVARADVAVSPVRADGRLC